MSAALDLLLDGEPVMALSLGETIADNKLAFGQAHRVTVRNVGTTRVRELHGRLDGPGAQHVQLAIDTEEGPGIWSSVGEGIAIDAGELKPGETASFWIRGTFSPEDAEGYQAFEVTFDGISY